MGFVEDQLEGGDFVALGQDHWPFEYVAQFPDVSLSGMVIKHFHDLI